MHALVKYLFKQRVRPLTEFNEVPSGERHYGPAPTCPDCGRFVGLLTWTPPFDVDLDSWSPLFGDIVFGSGNYDFLVSERFRDLYLKHNLSGLTGFEPVLVKRVVRRAGGNATPPQYYRASVAFSTTAIDAMQSGIERELSKGEVLCPTCRSAGILKRWSRVVIEPNTYSGEDIAIPRGLFMYLVTTRFKHMCEHNNILNATFVPIADYRHDFYPWEQERNQ